MKNDRQTAVLQIIEETAVETQEQLMQLLAVRGFACTQATVSRDIKQLHLFAEIRRVGTVVKYQQHRVITGQRTHDIRILHAVQREGGGVGHAVHGLDDRQVLRVFR